MESTALWVPLLWILIVGSRPISAWLGAAPVVATPDDYLEGSPLDRNVYLFLIAAGLTVLLRRRVNWGALFEANRWLLAFFLYCGVSVVWSDYPFVGFKRWIKDVGNLVMVLVMLSERDPIEAVRAVFVRYIFVVVPLSILLIKYYSEIGRYYSRWTWEVYCCGAATEKNALGSIAFVCGLFLIWDVLALLTAHGRRTDRTDLLSRTALLLMVIWLMVRADSSTAFVCLFLGAGMLLIMRLPFGRRQVRHLGAYSLAAGLLLLILSFAPDIREAFAGTLGRDATLTGRTDLWKDLLNEPVNPVLGIGYQSFWMGPRAEYFWEKYYFHPNQAHNGYLETYLNGGLVGVTLLLAVIVAAARRLKAQLLQGSSHGALLLSLLVVGVVYNWSEAAFNRLGLIWITLLIAAVAYTRSPRTLPDRRHWWNTWNPAAYRQGSRKHGLPVALAPGFAHGNGATGI